MPGELAPRRFQAFRLSDKNDAGRPPEIVVNLPGSRRIENVVAHDLTIRQKPQQTTLRKTAKGNCVVFRFFEPCSSGAVVNVAGIRLR